MIKLTKGLYLSHIVERFLYLIDNLNFLMLNISNKNHNVGYFKKKKNPISHESKILDQTFCHTRLSYHQPFQFQVKRDKGVKGVCQW